MSERRDQRGSAIRSLAERGGARRYWRYEHRDGDESAGLWYGECVRHNDQWWCIRQVAPHPGGVSAYDWEHLEDEHGFLTDQPVDEDESPLEAVSAEEFEAAWREASLGAAAERPPTR